MRIVISNPDGIGDVVLRLPLFEALREAGHELLLICRSHGEALLRRLGMRVEVLRENPYVLTQEGRTDFSPEVVKVARDFAPQLLVFAAYHWTNFEEHLAVALPGVERIRMNGRRCGPWRIPIAPGSAKWERVVLVEEWSHEAVKNKAMGAAILGRDVTLGDPVLLATEADIQAGRASLATAFGDEMPGELWIGCMGSTGDFYGDVKDWGRAQWREILRHVVQDRDGAMVLVGSDAERGCLETLRKESGIGHRVHIATGDAGQANDFSPLLGLIALARGYVGKDTGPMHIAGALGKPVVAVYGGGHWPRFVPRVTPSWAATMDLPCLRCEWACHMPESLCVKRIPIETVKRAMDAVISGELRTRECVKLPASGTLLRAANCR